MGWRQITALFPLLFYVFLWCPAPSPAAGQPRNGSGIKDLSGTWGLRLDPKDIGVAEKWFDEKFSQKTHLPGSLAENGYGKDISTETEWVGSIVDKSWYTDPKYAEYRKEGNVKVPFWLTPEKHYVGVAWYQREIEIPAPWQNERVVLFLERCHWKTTAWLDGKKLGSRNSLSTPHVYDLGRPLKAGKHNLVLRVDNRMQVNVGQNAHSISDHTQTDWNGVAGDIELRLKEPVRIEDIQVYPDVEGRSLEVKLSIAKDTKDKVRLDLKLEAHTEDGSKVRTLPCKRTELTLSKPVEVFTVTYPMGKDVLLWDEFSPNLYTLEASLRLKELVSTKQVQFGMREFETEGTRFTVNGRLTFLRGTLECCIFPLTGYPAMEPGYWRRMLSVARAHGLNHLRFHSWCPPEAAFEAADRMGIYFHVECGAWTTVGNGKPIDDFIYAEGERILKYYGNHPSFCMLAYGNEPGGSRQKEFLGKLVNHWKGKDPRHLYTSAAGWPIIPESDYHSTPGPRVHQWGQGLNCRFNAKRPATTADYREFVSKYEVPVVSHEIGQWCVYPNLKEIPKYTGVLKPYNFEIVRDSLKEKGMLDQSEDFLLASGKLQALCYKEEIEAALRTPGFGGFQLLDLHDFPGQGTALVGVRDAFWDGKGYIEAEEYHRFACETVPLARMEKRVWRNSETFRAEIEASHFGPGPIAGIKPAWKITKEGGRQAASGRLGTCTVPLGNCFKLGVLEWDLSSQKQASRYTLSVSFPGTSYGNSWDFWVYPASLDVAKPEGIFIADFLDEKALQKLKAGGKVLLMPAPGSVKGDKYGPVPPAFSPIFWNTAWTRRQPPHTLGILCEDGHPAFDHFPTAFHSDWNWWDLVTKAQVMILSEFPPSFRPLVQVVDDWNTNRKLALMFEARVEKGKLMVCSMDLKTDLEKRPVAGQMLYSLFKYMSGPGFEPENRLKAEAVKTVQKKPTVMSRATIHYVDSEAPGYEARKAIDGSSHTFWHTPWKGDPPGFPHEIQIDLGEEVLIKGFRYLPRQDMQNGRIRKFEFYASSGPDRWGEPVAKGTFEKGRARTEVTFSVKEDPEVKAKAVRARYVRFVALSPQDPEDIFASASELELITPGK